MLRSNNVSDQEKTTEYCCATHDSSEVCQCVIPAHSSCHRFSNNRPFPPYQPCSFLDPTDWRKGTEAKTRLTVYAFMLVCVCVWQMMIITKPTSPWSKTTTNHSTALSLILLITSHKSDGPWVMSVYPRKAHYRSLGSRDIIKVQMVLVCVCTQNLWERCAAENGRFVSTCLSWP